ncbi:hypothetical protein V8G61_06065 [Gaetbulibacter sp. M240]|uniref:hypothetical protein n=1 Tax=Gaetbulibacter sp. M240 TaxID=3126511 RepID=UPI00374FD580
MKRLKKFIKSLAILFSILIFIQSCTVYKAAPSSLSQASKAHARSKVVNQEGEVSKFKFITEENGSFYGIKRSKGTLIKVKLNENHLKSIKTKDKTMSIMLTIVVSITVIIGLHSIVKNSITLGLPSPVGTNEF